MVKFKKNDKVKFFNCDGLSAEGVVTQVGNNYRTYMIRVTKILKADKYLTSIHNGTKDGMRWSVPETHLRPLR